MSSVAPFDPERLIRTLRKHRVDFVLIGALAARLYGFPRLTADADIVPDPAPKNLVKLAAALNELDAKIYTETIPEGLSFDCSPAMLSRATMWNLVTAAGRLDLAFAPSGTKGYAGLADDAGQFEAFGTKFLVASLDDIIRSKEAAGRPKDREDVAILKAIRARN